LIISQPQVHILQRERNATEDQKIKPPLPNTILDEYDDNECQEEEYEEDNIHCVEAELERSHLTQDEYEEALINEQVKVNSNDNDIFQAGDKGRYNLRSKTIATKHSSSIPPPPKKTAVPAKQQVHKEHNSKD